MSSARTISIAAALAAGLWAGACGSNLPARVTPAVDPATPQPATPPPAGAIAGLVVSAADGRPVSRARVVVSAPALAKPRATLTGKDGRYRVPQLPAGLFAVVASKTGFVTTAFGVSPTGTPLAVDLAVGQDTGGVDIRLPVAGAIAGRILDADGTPFQGARVEARRPRYEQGAQTLAVLGSDITDDRGEFRIGGLAAGLYYVSAIDPHFEDVGDPQGPQEYSPTYHPGVVFPDDAARVRVDAGQVSPGVEFQLSLVRPARVSGRIAANDGRQLLSGAVIMTAEHGDHLAALPVRDVTINPDGTFEFRNVPPGRYVIRARGETDREGIPLFGRFSLDVSGGNVANVAITLAAGARVSGRVDFEGRTPPPAAARAAVRVHAVAVDGVSFGDAYSEPLAENGDFVFRGVRPGEHVLRLEGLPGGWALQAISFMGREVTDTPLQLDGGQVVRNLRVVASDVFTVVFGRVTDGAGRPRPDALVVAFPIDTGLWTPYSRHVQRARPDLDGHYRFRGLPPGDYLIIASDEIDEEDVLSPDLLERLSARAARMTLRAGQAKTQDLPVSSLRPQAAIGHAR